MSTKQKHNFNFTWQEQQRLNLMSPLERLAERLTPYLAVACLSVATLLLISQI